jgi:hypothetical protein
MARPMTQESHGPLQARVRRHPTNGTVRVRPRAGKRRQHSLRLSAPRPQPKRPRGSNLPPPRGNAIGARPDLERSYPAPHAHTDCVKRRRLQDDRVRCRIFIAESNEAASPNSSRRLHPLSDLLTVKLRGRTEASARRRGRTISSSARGAKQITPHGPLQRLLGGIAEVICYPCPVDVFPKYRPLCHAITQGIYLGNKPASTQCKSHDYPGAQVKNDAKRSAYEEEKCDEP